MAKPRIAVFSGPRSTIANTPTLVTSNKGRRADEPRLEGRFDHLVPQRLHEPVRVRIAKFSAHPLESDAAEVYHDDGNPYYEVELRPEDGAYLLPYVARRGDGSADGTPFEDEDLRNAAIGYGGRQTFFPDASRLFEEIDRGLAGRGHDGAASELDRIADYDFVRVLPPAGYTKQGETAGRDFFPYSPRPIGKFLPNAAMARAVNVVQQTIDSGRYDGFIWLEGSPHVEETLYWLSLVLDTALPFVGISSQRAHGTLANDGDRNIVDAARYIASGLGAGLGAVGIVDEQIFAARTFKKGDARPGGYRATGGHGGVLGSAGETVRVWFRPAYRTTGSSEVAVKGLPLEVAFQEYGDSPDTVSVRIKDDDGSLRGGRHRAGAHGEVRPLHGGGRHGGPGGGGRHHGARRAGAGAAGVGRAGRAALPRVRAGGRGGDRLSAAEPDRGARHRGLQRHARREGEPGRPGGRDAAQSERPDDRGEQPGRDQGAGAAARGNAAAGAPPEGARPTQPDRAGARSVARRHRPLPRAIRHALRRVGTAPG